MLSLGMFVRGGLSTTDMKILVICCVVDGVLLLGLGLTMAYLCLWRRRRGNGGGSMQASWWPRVRAYGDGINRRTGGGGGQETPETLWQCGKSMSREQLKYVKENCSVEISGVSCEEENPCAICLDIFGVQSPRNVLRLNCNHFFHEVCMSHWIVESQGGARCPLCKSLIPLSTENNTIINVT